MARAPLSLQNLRAFAIAHSMFQPTSLQAAIDRMGFVQADPIRSPARAQDLILRHRVRGYRAGDLERRYASLDVEEDYLYAFGLWRGRSSTSSGPLVRHTRECWRPASGAGER
jgi:uncharacterized protein YcaQ